jgi:enoyl-CoA hydratase/carnithine racemase
MAEVPTPVLIDQPAEGVARLRLNLSEARNALNMQLRKVLSDAFREVEEDESTRCALLCGSSTHFAVGADLIERGIGPGKRNFLDRAQHHRRLPDCSWIVAPLNYFDTADQKEAMRAFAQRRPPAFLGR